MADEQQQQQQGHNVLLVPYPSQGHFNPMLQFGKRLTFHGLRPILAAARSSLNTANLHPAGPLSILPISDGFDDGGFSAARDLPTYLATLERAGSQSLHDLIAAQRAAGRPIGVLIYDSFLPWALDLGKRLGLVCAAFFTQSCAVDAILCHAWRGRLEFPANDPVESLPGLGRLEPTDLPSFLAGPVEGPYPAYRTLVLNQFRNLAHADVVLINSFYELEREETDWMRSEWNVMTIGPTVPSKYLDNRLDNDSHYGFNLFEPQTHACMQWLNSKPPYSVVYVSFGSMAAVDHTYMEELAQGLKNSGKNFLWVVRQSETHKLPKNFTQEISDRGLVVQWSPQLEVLSHGAVGCFVTHCGWNSTVEALSLGVPMVAVPQWTDQPTNAKYVEDVWGVGVRGRVNEKGALGREEVERCIREVMVGEKGEEMRRNANKWKGMARQAMGEGGSSDKFILEFVHKFCS